MKSDSRQIEKDIGKTIRQLREKEGIGKKELAAKVGYKSPDIITKIEKGQKALNLDMICKLSAALRVEPTELILSEKITTTRENLLKDFLYIIQDPVDLELYQFIEVSVKLTASRKRALRKIEDLFEQLKHNKAMEISRELAI